MAHNRNITQKFESHVRWCEQCNVPLTGKTCDLCGNKGKAIKISGPGDVKIALSHDKKKIAEAIAKIYGEHSAKIIKKKIIILNRRPDIDKTEEIIIDGEMFGLISFDLQRYIFIPTAKGASMLKDVSRENKLTAKETTGHLKGKYISKDAIENLDKTLKKGNYVTIILKNNKVALGQIKEKSYEQYIKILDVTDNITFSTKDQSIKKILNANKRYMAAIEKRAKETIKKYSTGLTRNNVAFSGGKDSLVVLDLTLETIKDVDVFFIDTGLEFSETIEHVKKVSKSRKIKINVIKNNKDFFKLAEKFGPPAKDYRWCCKSLKYQPLVEFIDAKYGDKGCTTFEGRRKLESFSRSTSKESEKNPFITKQISVYPILNWKSIDVWLYIIKKELEYNKLYDAGLERIGCFLCPAQLECEFNTLKQIKPNEYNAWSNFLIEWARRNGLEKRYISLGFWRWKHHPNKILNLSQKLNIQMIPKNREHKYSVQITQGKPACHDKIISIESMLKGQFDIEYAENYLNVLGTTRYSKNLGIVSVKTKIGNAKIFAGGQIISKAKTKNDAIKIAEDVVRTIIRFEKCTLCELCKSKCKTKQIEIKDKVIIKKDCTHCNLCSESCVVYQDAKKIIKESKEI
ncbi:MAG: phosphoadenosine phosphosulfate reductase family protein [DPANN group archaeon]|nr:phosphoadenosine phosphosulfate reductase family protein [DPANN group archaeon]